MKKIKNLQENSSSREIVEKINEIINIINSGELADEISNHTANKINNAIEISI